MSLNFCARHGRCIRDTAGNCPACIREGLSTTFKAVGVVVKSNEVLSLEQQVTLLKLELRTKQEALDKALGEVGRLKRSVEGFLDVTRWFLVDRQPFEELRKDFAGTSPDENEEG